MVLAWKILENSVLKQLDCMECLQVTCNYFCLLDINMWNKHRRGLYLRSIIDILINTPTHQLNEGFYKTLLNASLLDDVLNLCVILFIYLFFAEVPLRNNTFF